VKIKRVTNNNILCAVAEHGNEMIVTGRGIGFKRNIGELIDPAQVEKTYRMEDKAGQRRLRELVAQIPLEHLKLTEELIEYIKGQIYNVLTAIGKEKVKGTFYSFAPAISTKTEVDKEILEEKYLGIANQALETILPPWVSFKLSASVKAVPEGEEGLPSEFKVVTTPTCKFIKPRAKKEE
jgi:hypothetical protein